MSTSRASGNVRPRCCHTFYADSALGIIREVFLPDGTATTGPNETADETLTRFLGVRVTLSEQTTAQAVMERGWTTFDGVPDAAILGDASATHSELAAAAPQGTFFDYAPIHIISTSSLRRLRREVPNLDSAVERFRPNLVVDTDGDDFVENEWLGRDIEVGDDVVLRVVTPSPRCAMPTLPQGADIPQNTDVLRALVRTNRVAVLGMGRFACLGAYAKVVRAGLAKAGDRATIR